MRGMCYVPTWARTASEILSSLCRHDVMRRELGFIRALNLNSVRLWLSIHGYAAEPDIYLSNLRFFLDTCEELGLAVHLNLFDSVGIDPEDALAPVVAKEDTFGGRAGEIQARLGFPNADATALVPIPDCGREVVLATEWWIASPGYRHLGVEEWPRCAAFVRAIVGAVGQHPALVLLEVMNEPELASFGSQQVNFEPVARFYRAMYDELRAASNDLPTTIGSTRLANFRQADADTGMGLDVISFHSFNSADGLREAFREAREYAAQTGHRPVICSEWGTWPGVTDERQLALYQAMLPVALDSGAAWEIAHLIAAPCNGANSTLLYASGTMRPAAMYLREKMRSASGVVAGR